MSKFKDRLITGIILVAILVLIGFTNSYIMGISILILSSIAIIEMANAFEKLGYRINKILALLSNFFIMLAAFFNNTELMLLVLTITVAISLILETFIEGYKLENQFALIFLLSYISIMFSYLIRMPNKESFFLVFILAWGTDTFAYLVGMLIGKHQLTKVSPKKTIEGSIGGIVGAVILTIIYHQVLGLDEIIKYIILAILGGVLSQVGDISASSIKRKANIKDYGNILKGHGGIMDRFDSVIFLGPLVYYFVALI